MLYSLVLKNQYNQPLPIEWDLLPDYNGENIYSLEAIDLYTSKMSEEDLRYVLLNEFGYDTSKQKMAIISKVGDYKATEIDYGVCFKENKQFLNAEFVLNCIKENINDKNFLNRIYNEFNKMQDKSPAFEDLISVIHRTPIMENELNNIYYIDYIELRSLGMFISTLLPPKYENEEIKNNIHYTTPDVIIKKDLTKESA